MKKFATFISRVFDPFIMLAVACIVLLSHTEVFIPAFVTMVFLPFLLFIIAVKTKLVSNWDVSDRQERPKLFWPLVAIEIISIVVFQLWFLFPMIVAFAGFSLITHFWKISGHAFASALTTGILISRLGWLWWPVLFIVPLVGWSRVIRKNHTILQFIAGALYAWLVVFIFL